MASGSTKTAKAASRVKKERVKLQEATIEVERRGKGKPILLLQSEEAYEASLPFVDSLAEKREVIIPWAPGFGRSTFPESVTSIDDIAYLYLDLLDRYKLTGVSVVGFSVGGWIAAEMATKNCGRIGKLVLVDAVGAKFGGPYDRDIEDIYFHPAEKVASLKFLDPSKDPLADMASLSDKQAMSVARHREVTAKLCWKPYFHNPSLKHRLHRIQAKTLVVWGAKDGFVTPKYGRAYAKRVPGAKFVSIPKAGHYPHIEQPEGFMKELRGFLR